MRFKRKALNHQILYVCDKQMSGRINLSKDGKIFILVQALIETARGPKSINKITA